MISIDGVEMYGFTGAFGIPNDPKYGGVSLWLRDQAGAGTIDPTTGIGSNDILLGTVGAPGTMFQTSYWPIHDNEPTWDLYFVSYDVNNKSNTLVPGITPRITGLHPVHQTSGSLKGGRIDPATLDPSMSILSAALAVANLGITNAKVATAAIDTAKLAALAVTTPKVALANITTALVANAAITTALIANAAITTALVGTAQITTALIANLAVTNAQIADATITSAKIVSLDVTKLNAGTISVAISLTSPTITVTTATGVVNMDATNYLKVTHTGLAEYCQVDGSGFRVIQNADATEVVFMVKDRMGVQKTAGGNTITLECGGTPALAINGVFVVVPSKTGWHLPTGTLSRATFDQSTVTLQGLAQAVAALVTDLYSWHALITT